MFLLHVLYLIRLFLPQFYRRHNIRVLLVGLEVWDAGDKILVSVSENDTLTRFIQWRQNELLGRIKHDNAQLVT